MSIEMVEFFFLNTWLWGMTWGVSHVPINIIVMLALFKFVGRLKIMTAILLAFFSKVFASALYTMLVSFLVFVVKLKFIPLDNVTGIQGSNLLLACIYLGLIYSALQTIFFLIVNKFYEINLRVITLIVFVSNIISSLLVYRFLEIN